LTSVTISVSRRSRAEEHAVLSTAETTAHQRPLPSFLRLCKAMIITQDVSTYLQACREENGAIHSHWSQICL